MGKINVGRVILGGLVAGVVINIFEYVLNMYVIVDQNSAAMTKLGLGMPTPQQIGVFIAMGFLLGILLIFVYAAMRPRFGAGVKTAIIAGVTVAVAGWPTMIVDRTLGITPGSLANTVMLVGIVELSIAAIVGAWLYKEA
jgi:hypothetical protein